MNARCSGLKNTSKSSLLCTSLFHMNRNGHKGRDKVVYGRKAVLYMCKLSFRVSFTRTAFIQNSNLKPRPEEGKYVPLEQKHSGWPKPGSQPQLEYPGRLSASSFIPPQQRAEIQQNRLRSLFLYPASVGDGGCWRQITSQSSPALALLKKLGSNISFSDAYTTHLAWLWMVNLQQLWEHRREVFSTHRKWWKWQDEKDEDCSLMF